MRPPAFVALVVALALTASGCGGDDVFPRDEFVKQVTAGGVTRAVAACTYDGIESNAAVMADIVKADGPNDKISVATDQQLSKIIARCLLDTDSGGQPSPTTTERPTSKTTTTRKRSTTTADE